jgi:hypothetical protein
MWRGELDAARRLDERSFAIYNAESARQAKSVGVTYLLWFFFFGLGIHKFYLNKIVSGIVYLASFVTIVFGFSYGMYAVSAMVPGGFYRGFGLIVWLVMVAAIIFLVIAWFVDLFTIPSQVANVNGMARWRILQQLLPPEVENAEEPLRTDHS